MNRAILWVSSPTQNVVNLMQAREWDLVIYDCVADYSDVYPYQHKQVLAAENALVKRANIILTISQLLEQKLQRYKCSNIHRLPNGLDLARFAHASKMPPQMSALRHPILGFLGDMPEKVFDVTLVANMAKSHPEWRVVLVGPIAPSFVTKIDDAPLHLLGPVAYDEVPAYLRAFDVGLIPLLENGVTRAMNPMKIYEYLACGLPVISSPIPDMEISAIW